jgi:hypothetical protein
LDEFTERICHQGDTLRRLEECMGHRTMFRCTDGKFGIVRADIKPVENIVVVNGANVQ